MKNLRFILAAGVLLLLAAAPSFAQQATTVADTTLSDRRVRYRMDVRLRPTARTVTGTERLTWRNPAPNPVDTLQFHLYLNAFSGPNSTFMKESGGEHRGQESGAWGGVTIDRMQLAGGGPVLTDSLHFLHPDGNEQDSTVAAVALPEPVAPGDSVTLAIDFTVTMPEIFARTGWKRRADGQLFFLMGQWFPKLGVYEPPGQRYVPDSAKTGRWSTHAFHANSEFYADFGTYRVTMTVPAGYAVGATGVRTSARRSDSTRTLTYRADDVHDFAWTTSPAFQEYTDQWKHVKLRLLLQPEHDGQVQRHFRAAKAALKRFSKWVGPYPYTTLTLVDGLGGANGMEYPTFITCGTAYMLPSWARLPEFITVHEFGHQYFYGLLASNEAEEAWLDEGFTSYVESRVMGDAYGPGSVLNVPGLRLSDFGMQRLQYVENDPSQGAIYQRSWKADAYGKTTYAKPATVLRTLERYLGWKVMREVLRAYYRRWRFRHPTTEDFQTVAENVSGEDLGWFFDQYIYGTAAVDYAIDSVTTTQLEDNEAGRYRHAVHVRRKRNGVFPQKLRLRLADGSTRRARWNGKAKRKTFAFESEARWSEAYLDPKEVVWMDVDRLNNRRTRREDETLARKYQLKTTVWLQQLFALF